MARASAYKKGDAYGASVRDAAREHTQSVIKHTTLVHGPPGARKSERTKLDPLGPARVHCTHLLGSPAIDSIRGLAQGARLPISCHSVGDRPLSAVPT